MSKSKADKTDNDKDSGPVPGAEEFYSPIGRVVRRDRSGVYEAPESCS